MNRYKIIEAAKSSYTLIGLMLLSGFIEIAIKGYFVIILGQ